MRAEIPGAVMGVLDLEVGGAWLQVTAVIAEPEPGERPRVFEIQAADKDGVCVLLPELDAAALAERFERAYYRWRARGVYEN